MARLVQVLTFNDSFHRHSDEHGCYSSQYSCQAQRVSAVDEGGIYFDARPVNTRFDDASRNS